jgi:hypothetical protein
MGKILFVALLCLILAVPLVMAITSGEAKQAWYDAKDASKDAQQAYNDARIEWAADKSAENDQKVVSAGRDALNAALDEAEAWLIWTNASVSENPEIASDLKQTISQDVGANLAKIPPLRDDVAHADTQLELGVVWLEMAGKYVEMLTDVCRNTGYVWAEMVGAKADDVDHYEQELRASAWGMQNNTEIIAKLDSARSELSEARGNIGKAKASYDQVRLPGTPLIKFSEGNSYLRVARDNLLSAVSYLTQAFALIARGG